ncbi:MAG: nuclear transport factor 2 family protein [Thermoleophilia bacterium]|nr:nuclear transport factor 2 family protein [Thermoleophilia bacterium]
MASDLLKRIREAYGAWNEGELERTLEFLAPDVEWHTSASFPGTQPLYRGHEGFKLFWNHLHEPWEQIHVEIESYQREDEVAILRIRFHGTGKDSGVDVDLPWFQVLVIEDDLVVRSALDRTVGDALEALDVSDAFPEF